MAERLVVTPEPASGSATRWWHHIRACDVVLVLVILGSTAHLTRLVAIDYSPVRALFSSYLLLAMCLWQWLRTGRSTPRVAGALVLVALAFLGYWTWQSRLGSWQAVNLWHELILAVSLLVYAMVFGPRRWQVWRIILVGFGMLAAAVQIVGLLLFADELATRAVYGPAAFYGARALHANAALFMVAALCVILADRRISTRWQIVLGMVLGLSAVYSQWRSVWAALAVVLVMSAWRSWISPGQRRSLYALAGVAVSWVVIVFFPMLTGRSLLPGGGVEAVGSVQLPDTATSSGTLGWRFEMWESRLEAPRSLSNLLFGGVFSDSNVVYPGAGIMRGSLSGHNVYVDLYTYLGLAGLSLFMLLAVLALRTSSPGRWEQRILLVSALVYGVFFFWAPWIWILLGVPANTAQRETAAPIPPPGYQ